MKEKIISLCLLISLGAISVIGTSLTYLTDDDKASNVITSGGVDIKIIEKTEGSDGTLIDFPEKGLDGIMPGTNASKIVSVKNIGSAEAWIRVEIDISVTSADGEELPKYLNIGNKSIPIICPDIGDDWFIGSDGYYYYLKPVAEDASTSNLMERVSFAPQMGNEYQNCTVTLTISAQAVQAAHNPENREQYGDNAILQANGWPA